MDDVWDNSSRFEAISIALANLPHDQVGLGMGFRLTHNPTNCRRCRATIANLELASIINYLENPVEEGVEVDA